ncbi:MAG: peptide/nickel transport system substrate-binding protein [Rhodospirillaceae bacterium]|nr:peptide/nickel transport system substrate-binding protein [Rhodospirillaceae bacterium]
MTIKSLDRGLTRRRLLQGAAMAGAMATLKPRLSLAEDGKVLRVRSYADIQNLDPAFRTGQPDGDVMQCIFAPLAHFKPNVDGWEAQPLAAKTLKQLDATHVAFELHPGIVYSDGYGEMTADDVKFSFERIADPKTKADYHDDWAQLDHVEVKDKYSGIIVMKKAFAPLWTSTLPTDSAVVLPKKAYDAVGGKFTTKPPCQVGPYRIKSWEPKTKMVLERNPDWKLYRPDFDEIHIMPIEDEKTAELGFEGGELDYTFTSVSSIPRYMKSPPAGAKFVHKPSLAYVWLGINQDFPQFKDQRVRRAIQLAVDRKAVVDAAYLGAAETATGIIAPGLPGHRDTNLYSRDVEQAKKLLKEAGLENGFSTTLAILNKAERIAAAQVVQANLAEVAITVQIEQHDSGTFWTLGSEKDGKSWQTLQLILDRFSMQPDPSWATAWFTPEQIGVWNWERFNSKEFGELHAKALVELDPAKRAEMYIKMQNLMEESGDYVFLTHEASGVLYKDKIMPALRPDGVPILPLFRKA